MRENPQFYQEFMQRLAQDDPSTFQAIQANPLAFMNMVMNGSPNLAGVPGGARPAQPGAGGAGGAGMPGMPAGARPPGNAIQVNPQ